jgi:hypothetical protein
MRLIALPRQTPGSSGRERGHTRAHGGTEHIHVLLQLRTKLPLMSQEEKTP